MRNQKSYQLFVSVLSLGVLVSAIVMTGCSKSEPENKGKLPEAAVSGMGPAKTAKAEFQGLVGNWVRPDVGYTLEIHSVAADGKMDVSYSAPRAVAVGKAAATVEGGSVKVVIELSDPSLAGSKYSLKFDSQADRLNGTYYQAALGESFDVFFVRTQ
jgi:hypothetical protein